MSSKNEPQQQPPIPPSPTKEEETENTLFSFNSKTGNITLFNSMFEVNIYSLFLQLCGVVILWLLAWLLFPKQATQILLINPRGGMLFDPICLFVVGTVCVTILGKLTGMPALILFFYFGLFWGNVPRYDYLTSGITKETRRVVSRLGLALIMLRTGLAINPKVIMRAKWTIISLSILPLAAEFFAHGFVAGAIFDDYSIERGQSKLWPFLQGIVVAPSASGVVAAVIMMIQLRGYTKTRGPGVLLIPACAIDMTIGVWSTSFVASLVLPKPGTSLGWAIGQGPVQLVVGFIFGVVCGCVWYFVGLNLFCRAHIGERTIDVLASPFPRHEPKTKINFVHQVRSYAVVSLFFFACLNVFFSYYIESAGAGVIGCTLTGATASYLLNLAKDRQTARQAFAEDEEDQEPFRSALADFLTPDEEVEVRSELSGAFAWLWDKLIMPCLYSFSASAVNAESMFNTETLGFAIAAIFIGLISRAVVAAACMFKFPLTNSEWIIGAICLGGKAYTQAALANIGLQIVDEEIARVGANLVLNNSTNSTFGSIMYSPSFATQQEYFKFLKKLGTNVLNTGALSMFFVSPIVTALLNIVGPKWFWLTDEEFFAKEKREKEEQEQLEKEMEKKNEDSVVEVDKN